MADFVPIPFGILLRVTGQHTSGKKLFNVVHAKAPNALPSATDVQDAATALASWCVTSYKALFTSNISLVEIRARSIAQEPGPEYVDAIVPVAGNLSTEQLPLATASCVNLQTGTTGYSRRGRFFVFSADETVETGGLFSASYATACGTTLELLIGDMAAANYPLVIASYRHLTLYEVLSARGNVIPAHLRSRRPDKGI